MYIDRTLNSWTKTITGDGLIEIANGVATFSATGTSRASLYYNVPATSDAVISFSFNQKMTSGNAEVSANLFDSGGALLQRLYTETIEYKSSENAGFVRSTHSIVVPSYAPEGAYLQLSVGVTTATAGVGQFCAPLISASQQQTIGASASCRIKIDNNVASIDSAYNAVGVAGVSMSGNVITVTLTAGNDTVLKRVNPLVAGCSQAGTTAQYTSYRVDRSGARTYRIECLSPSGGAADMSTGAYRLTFLAV